MTIRSNMRTIDFTVSEQRLRCDEKPHIIAGSKGYLKARFSFSPDWKGYAKAVSFFGMDDEEHPVELRNDEAAIPDEVTDGPIIRIQVFGMKGDAKVKTNVVALRQRGA